ncbi:MAG TPA: SigE family RNA polymerase sigma factor [Trebonia sp.]|jgi:RNA polymerase sigma-70 factor (sigma-E family)|nr:SigE family RNA polymerase sigma factor [Trebonia sp.]
MALSTRDEEFSSFVRTSRPELLRSARLLTAGDLHRAEDLVQTALARLYVAWPKVRRTDTQHAYAWRILVNAHIDEVRRPRWRRERPVAAPPELADLPDPAMPQAFADGVDAAAVRAALAALPPGMRAAVVLRHWADFSIEETAAMLGCSEGTVKSQTAKAIAKLRDLLGTDPPAGRLPNALNITTQTRN